MKLSLNSLQVGISTADALKCIVSENTCIAAVHVFDYPHPRLLQERLELSADEKALILKAKALRASSALPFWEALLVSCFAETRDYSRLLQQASFHQSHRDASRRITREEVLNGRLNEVSIASPVGQHSSFSSNVETNNCAKMHLPLLDFHCPENLQNDRLVQSVCVELLGIPALVFASGESYHAIGSELVSDAKLQLLLARALLFSPVVDSRYVAHQMLEGRCALRLSNSESKPHVPNLKFVCNQRGAR